MWQVRLTDYAEKQLAKLDTYQARLLVEWMEKNLEGCKNPRHLGEVLGGSKAGLWRYRVGRYRILAELKDGVVLIRVVQIGHRRKVYR